jgi:hypothetical protein
MGGTDVLAALKAANTRRHQAALAAARQAIATLQRSGSTITFTAVAKSSGVARSWLYQQAELRQLIGRLRTAAPPPAVDYQRASTESLHRMAEALRLETTRLREENKTLKEQLARQLGLTRAQHKPHSSPPGEDMSSPSSPGATRALFRET